MTIGDRRSATPVRAVAAVATGAVATYKVEPFVMAADVYAMAPHIGRGGWTWFAGAAGWMYRLVLESRLGRRLRSAVAAQGSSIQGEGRPK